MWEAEGVVKQAADYIHCPGIHKAPCHLKGRKRSFHRAMECSSWAERQAIRVPKRKQGTWGFGGRFEVL